MLFFSWYLETPSFDNWRAGYRELLLTGTGSPTGVDVESSFKLERHIQIIATEQVDFFYFGHRGWLKSRPRHGLRHSERALSLSLQFAVSARVNSSCERAAAKKANEKQYTATISLCNCALSSLRFVARPPNSRHTCTIAQVLCAGYLVQDNTRIRQPRKLCVIAGDIEIYSGFAS